MHRAGSTRSITIQIRNCSLDNHLFSLLSIVGIFLSTAKVHFSDDSYLVMLFHATADLCITSSCINKLSKMLVLLMGTFERM